MSELLALTYVGEGAYRPDLPARDLDHAEIALLSEAQRAVALSCGLYRPTYAGEAGADVPGETPLAEKPKAELLGIAGELGLELPKRSTNADIVEAIEAEFTRLADEATASDDGEGNQGGDATPGDDPEAPAPEEPGTPPAEPEG